MGYRQAERGKGGSDKRLEGSEQRVWVGLRTAERGRQGSNRRLEQLRGVKFMGYGQADR